MKTYTPKEELIKILHGENIGYFPRAITLSDPIVDMMKITDTYFPDAFYKPEPMAILAMAVHELGSWNCVMLPYASTVEMEALGAEVTVKKNDIAEYPQFKKAAFNDAYDIKFGNDILEKGSIPAGLEATKIVKETIEKKYNGEIPIVSSCEGPFTIASYVIGVDKMFKYTIKDTKRAEKALDVISDLVILYANKLLSYGGDVISLPDPVAEGLSSKQFEDILIPVYKKIAKYVNAPMIIHICGRTSKILKHIPKTGFEGFSFDYPKVSVDLVKQSLENKVKIVGSVPTITHLLDGSKEDVFKISIDMIKNGVDILSPSCGLPQYTPLENVKAMAEAIKYYNKEYYDIDFYS